MESTRTYAFFYGDTKYIDWSFITEKNTLAWHDKNKTLIFLCINNHFLGVVFKTKCKRNTVSVKHISTKYAIPGSKLIL